MLAHKLADRVKAPWRMALTLVAVTAGASFVAWTGDGTCPHQPGRAKHEAAAQPKWIHVKVTVTNREINRLPRYEFPWLRGSRSVPQS